MANTNHPAERDIEREMFEARMLEERPMASLMIISGTASETLRAEWLSLFTGWKMARAAQATAEPVAWAYWMVGHPQDERHMQLSKEKLRGRIYSGTRPLIFADNAPDRAPSTDSTVPAIPRTPEAVIAMIGSHYYQQQTHTDEGVRLELEDVTYTLTVHDLLSAFDDWQDWNDEADSAAGWISVEDRLPEWAARDDTHCVIDGKIVPPTLTSETVLVVIAPHAGVRIDKLITIEGSKPWFDSYRDRVTHWQPPPAPPIAAMQPSWRCHEQG